MTTPPAARGRHARRYTVRDMLRIIPLAVLYVLHVSYRGPQHER
jgi:hypothetical protein